VDDDRTIREACREVAQSLGFNAQVAESAEQAMRQLDSTDAVLLDLRPGAESLEALQTIKKYRPMRWSSWSPAMARCSRRCRP
jgi:DNA-binding NtrC family response regulator